MPVLINTDTGSAEEIAKPNEALAAGSHEIPIISPDGDFGSASLADARELMKQGYTQPTSEHLGKLLKEAKYGTTSQQIVAGAEQVGRGALGSIPTMVERSLGVPDEDISGREESLSTAAKMGLQGLGLVGGSLLLPGGGQAGALEKLGEGGARLLGIGEATSTLGRVGTAAAKAAIENAAYQAGDEHIKMMISNDQRNIDQIAASAMANIGLAAVIGAGFGTAGAGIVSPLWEATVGPKLEGLLRPIINRANGETVPLSNDLSTVLAELEAKGIKVSPEIRAGLSDHPMAGATFKQLVESGTGTGDALRETLDKFKGDVGDQLASVFQKEEAISAHEAGEKAKQMILEQANQLHEVISEKYKDIMPHLEAIQIPDEARYKFYQNLLKNAQEEIGTDSPLYGLVKNYGDRVLARDSIGKLKQLATEIGSDASASIGDFEKKRVLFDLRSSLKEFQDRQMIASGKALEKQGVPGAAEMGKELVKDKKIADAAYTKFLDTVSDIASVAKLGKVRTHGQLLEALEKIPAAKLADKLFDKKNIEGLTFLQKQFPEVFDTILRAKKSAIYEAATKTGDLKHTGLLNAVNGLPKEVRNMMFNKEEQATINASARILRESNKRMNPSGTANTMDKLMQHMPAGVGAMASFILGHGAIAGYLAGEAAKFLGRDAPDAAKMSLLKLLGSTERLDGTAFKAASDFINAALKGETLLVKASKAAIKAGQEVLPKSQIPDQKSREKLDKKLKELQVDNSSMLNVGGKISHYMPEHAGAMAGISMNAVNYLNQLRPKMVKASPLDTEIEPSKATLSNYHRALDIAEQPLVVMQSIQDGTLTPMDIKHLNSMYPAAYSRMSLALTDAMANHVSKEEPIKYNQRMGLSLFLAQPLDSTMTPMSIIAAQPPPSANQQQQQMTKKGPSQTTQKAMTNLAKGNASGSQMREMQKAGMAKA